MGGWGGKLRLFVAAAGDPEAEAVEVEVDDGGGVEGEGLAEDQSADDGDAEGAAEFGAGAGAEGEGEPAEEGGHGGHGDGAEAEDARFEDGVARGFVVGALGLEGEVDHHDGVFLDDADEQDDADEADDAELFVAEHQGEQRADAGGGERREDGDGVDVALVEDAEHDVDGDEGGEDQEELVGAGGLEGLGGALEGAVDGGGEADVAFGLLDLDHGIAEGVAGEEIEGDGDGGKLSLVVDSEGRGGGCITGEGAEGDLRAAGAADVEVTERVGVLTEGGVDLHDDVVLVEGVVDRGGLPLAEGIVERGIDHGGGDAEAGGGGAVDFEPGLKTVVLLIAVHIGEAGEGAEFGGEDWGPLE